MARSSKSVQRGISLIEVLVAILVLSVGLLGAAATQLNALKYTDSARMSSQASFIAYDMMDRIRVNSDAVASYVLGGLSAAPASADGSDVRIQDLFDFATNVRNFAGPLAAGSIAVNNRTVTIVVTWDDSRAEAKANTARSFTLVSRVAVDPVVATP
jgi:type IV pilus assembly protein PilV